MAAAAKPTSRAASSGVGSWRDEADGRTSPSSSSEYEDGLVDTLLAGMKRGDFRSVRRRRERPLGAAAGDEDATSTTETRPVEKRRRHRRREPMFLLGRERTYANELR